MHSRPVCLALALLALAAALGCAHAPCSPQASQVLCAVQECLGTPYCSGGAGAGGFDCSGLVQAVFRRAGVSLPRSAAGQMELGRPVGEGSLEPGDVVFFGEMGATTGATRNAQASGQATHCGVYLGGGRFAHASSTRGVTVSDLSSGYWRERFLAGRRYLAD